MTSTPLVLRNGLLVTMDPDRPQVEVGSVLIEEDRLVLVGPVDEVDAAVADRPDARVLDASNHAVLPGLVNAHMHSGLLRGTAEDLAIDEWIRVYVDPAHRVLQPEDARVAASVCYAESLLAGTTSVADLGRFGIEAARAAVDVGIRLHFAPYAGEDRYGLETVESTRTFLAHTAAHPHPRVHPWVGLEHLFYADEATTRQLWALAQEYGTGFHTHASESAGEVDRARAEFGHSPIVELDRRGLLGQRTLVAHCVALDDEDRALLATSGASVVHCPTSNLKLGCGVADVPALRRAGVRVLLGSDGEKENNSLEMFGELKLASLLRKGITAHPEDASAHEMLRTATYDAARALGLADLGALVAGHRADVICVDLSTPATTPLFTSGRFTNVCEHVVFAAGRGDVRHVVVDGEHVVQDGELVTTDVVKLHHLANEHSRALLQRAHQPTP
jgi:5-methylthioadenosine/S-adenosylhomocysteine deaminase